ncbi:MAG TPA: hypothetical protein VNO32_45220 [Candidatus Acidoferrum sp.]|nr:hypothetical protein [Candidatus Acidoferrum sp.]
MALLNEVLDANGGMDQWRRVQRFTVHVSIGGALLARKGKARFLKEIVARGSIETQSVRLTGLKAPDECVTFRPDRVAIERLDGTVLHTRNDPRAAFLQGFEDAPWDDLDLAYFGGLSVWNCLTIPFLLGRPEIKTEELAPWSEGSGEWARLKAIFPPNITTHSSAQIFSFDSARLQRRTDCRLVAMRGTPVADFSRAHQKFSGITLPTLRRSLEVGHDGVVVPKPPLIDIEIFDVSFD